VLPKEGNEEVYAEVMMEISLQTTPTTKKQILTLLIFRQLPQLHKRQF